MTEAEWLTSNKPWAMCQRPGEHAGGFGRRSPAWKWLSGREFGGLITVILRLEEIFRNEPRDFARFCEGEPPGEPWHFPARTEPRPSNWRADGHSRLGERAIQRFEIRKR
jgi:hypothetical protein